MSARNVFRNVGKPRLSDEAANQIEQAIREGRFLPGERLPSERTLTVKFGVSRPVLREALRQLEIAGLITIKHGLGTFVKDPHTDILHVPVASWLASNRAVLEQFYEARLVIEPECAALASQRATPTQIDALRELAYRSFEVTEDNVAPLVGMDIDFHSMIAQMSGNSFLAQMLDSLIVPETDVRKIVLRLPQHLPTTHADHKDVLDAIANRDPEAARQAMITALTAPLRAIKRFLNEE
jgi:GntR family transcriptional repressor for pyruvate dehydrogenase complex